MLRVQRLRLVLGKVMETHTVADRSAALLGRQNASQHLQERALAGAVFSDEGDPLPALHGKIQRVVDDLFAISFAHALEFQYVASARRGEWKLKFHPFGVPLQFDKLDLFQLFDTRLDLSGLVGLIAETIDELLDPSHLFGLTVRGGLELRISRGTEFTEFRIVASEFLDRPVANLPDVSGNTIQERGVVADHEQRQFGIKEKFLEPALCWFIEMVGR